MVKANVSVIAKLIGFDQVINQATKKISNDGSIGKLKNDLQNIEAEIRQAQEWEANLNKMVQKTKKQIQQNQEIATITAQEIRFLWIQFQQIAQQISSYYKDVAWIQDAFTVIQIGNIIDMARRFALETKEQTIIALAESANPAKAALHWASAAALGTLTVSTTVLQSKAIYEREENRGLDAQFELINQQYTGSSSL